MEAKAQPAGPEERNSPSEYLGAAETGCLSLSGATRRYYSRMRWGTVAGIVVATLLSSSMPPALLGSGAMGILLLCYVLLVRYRYGRSPVLASPRSASLHERVWATLPLTPGGTRVRLHPVPYLAASTLLVFVLMVMPSMLGEQSLWFCVLFFVVVGEASWQLRDAQALKVLVASCIALAVVAFLIVTPPGQRVEQNLSLIPFYVGLVAAAAGGWHQWQQEEEHAARLVLLDELQRSRADLERANHELQVYAGTVEDLAVATERNRLARELHDILGYTLATVVVKAEAAKRLIGADPQRAATELDHVREIARSGLAEVRRSVSGLRDTTQAPGVWHRAATRFVEQFGEQTRLCVTCTIEPLPPCHAPEVPPALFRIIQEALTNVARHARAAHVAVSLRVAGNEAVLEIRDDGIGIGPNTPAGGYGLQGMRERTALLGGTMLLSSGAGKGTSLTVCLPLHSAAALDSTTSAPQVPPVQEQRSWAV